MSQICSVKSKKPGLARPDPLPSPVCCALHTYAPRMEVPKLHNSALLTEGRYVDICWLLDRPLASAIQSLVRLFRRFFFRIFLCPVHIAGFIISSPYTNDTRVPGLTEVCRLCGRVSAATCRAHTTRTWSHGYAPAAMLEDFVNWVRETFGCAQFCNTARCEHSLFKLRIDSGDRAEENLGMWEKTQIIMWVLREDAR